MRPGDAKAFRDALWKAGVQAEVLGHPDLTHGEIIRMIGTADGGDLTSRIFRFLAGILHPKGPSQPSTKAISTPKPFSPRDIICRARDK